jgi:hypothetical protein
MFKFEPKANPPAIGGREAFLPATVEPKFFGGKNYLVRRENGTITDVLGKIVAEPAIERPHPQNSGKVSSSKNVTYTWGKIRVAKTGGRHLRVFRGKETTIFTLRCIYLPIKHGPEKDRLIGAMNKEDKIRQNAFYEEALYSDFKHA